MDEPEAEPETEPEVRLPRKSPEELEKLVQDIIAGQIFGSWNIPQEQSRMIMSVFMPLAFLEESQRDILKETAHIYAEMKDAGPRSINGMPCFFSMNLIGPEDWQIVADRVIKIQRQIDALSKGETTSEPESRG